jgi:peptide/nickel transport system permease protein
VRKILKSTSLWFLLALAAACLIGPCFIDASQLDLHHVKASASWQHWLGTDELGRDLLGRLLAGGRVSLSVGIIAALASALLGTLVGLLAGFFGGWADTALMRLTDGVLSLPVLPVLIVLSALDLKKLGLAPALTESPGFTIGRIILIVALFGWPGSARLVRGATLAVKERDYIRAARALGVGNLAIMRRHILPNVLSPLLVATSLAAGYMILTESILSFLGLGIQPPAASWGNMLTHAQELMEETPRLAIWPGLMIFCSVIAFNCLGDQLQQRFNPRRAR